MTRLGAGIVLVAGLVMALGGSSAEAQRALPPVRLLVGSQAGGSNDLIARILAERLHQITGDNYVVDNKPGASQRIAMLELKKAPPDGRTVIVATNGPYALLPTILGPKTGYDPVADYTPIARLVRFDLAFAIGPMVPATDLKGYVAWAKANPLRAAFGTPGAGTITQFMGLQFSKAAGVELTHVPYKGGTPGLTDLVGGHLPMLINGLPDMLEQHKAGTIHIVATGGTKRSSLLPDVPTLSELGFDVVGDVGIDIYSSANVPPDAVQQLHAALMQAINTPDTRQRFIKYGLEITPSTPAELKAFQAQEQKAWEEPIKASGYKGDE